MSDLPPALAALVERCEASGQCEANPLRPRCRTCERNMVRVATIRAVANASHGATLRPTTYLWDWAARIERGET
jgi:hypothetical protein